MNTIYELIAKKRDDIELERAEIVFLVQGYLMGLVTDYQMAAFLMAAFINGLSVDETAAMTVAMLTSGVEVSVPGLDRPLIDKHSTGGVGDKLSLTIAPVLANCGIAVGMFSGRGLGHTGGTLDKLESIPGMRVFHSTTRFAQLVKKHHFAICGQTAEVAPADSKIYALRDTTGTVESLPLIVASIMSKKLALKSNGILFDVKTGSGAFMKTRAHSVNLANALVTISKIEGIPARALITDMNQPTGAMIGNFLEIKETVDVLKGGGPADTVELTVELSAQMLLLAKAESNLKKARKRVEAVLASGHGYESFCNYVTACGGNVSAFEASGSIIKRANKRIVKSPKAGYIAAIATDRIGFLSGTLGAGRSHLADVIDPLAGMEMQVRLGDKVSAGNPLAVIYATLKSRLVHFDEAAFVGCFEFSDQKPKSRPLVVKRI